MPRMVQIKQKIYYGWKILTFEQLDLKLSPVFKIHTFLSIKPGSNKMKSELKFRTVYNKKNG